MSDDLRSVFDHALRHLRVPAGDLTAVVGRGRTRRRRRLAALAAGSAVIAATAGILVSNVAPGPPAPRPVAPGPDHRDLPLLPDEHLGPEPGPDLADPEDLADARAVTVAFHALVSRLPQYGLDYVGVVGDGDAWDVKFREVPEAESLESVIARHQARAGQMVGRVRGLEARVENLERRARSAAGPAGRRAAARAAELRARVEQLAAAERAQLEQALEEANARLEEEQRRTGGPFDVVLRVVLADAALVVDAVETESPDGEVLEAAAGYAEPVEGVDSWGADYFGLTFERAPGGGLSAEVFRFWTGPIPGSYEENCVPEVRDAANELVWRAEEPFGRYEGAPPTEDARDGASVTFGVDYEGPTEGLRMEMDCTWRPGF
jgi:hypothetical protein